MVGKVNKGQAKEIVHILMESKFYFALSLRERYDLIKNIIRKFPFTSRP